MRARQASNENDEATSAQRGWPSRRFRMEKRRASNEKNERSAKRMRVSAGPEGQHADHSTGKEGLKIEKNKGKAQYAKA